MSYILIDGKRHYRDDRTGETILDNVPQTVADLRELRKNTKVLIRQSVTQKTHNPLKNFITLFNRTLVASRKFCVTGLLILVIATFIHDKPQIRNRFQLPIIHDEISLNLRGIDGIDRQIQKVEDHIINLHSGERRTK